MNLALRKLHISRLELLALFVFSSTFILSWPAQSEPFAEFLRKQMQSGQLILPLQREGFLPEEAATKSDELVSLYTDALRERSLPHSNLEWRAQRLPQSLHLPFGQPTHKYSNAWLLLAYASQKPVAVFRSVDTTTGCNTGCTPVVFHLLSRPNGEGLEVIEDPKQPLRKSGHEIFNAADKEKLTKHLKRIPEGLATLSRPTLTTDSAAKFPPQTWTPLESTLVKGGAYTSFRVYQAALGLSLYLAKKDLLTKSHEEQSRLFGESLAITSTNESLAFLHKLEDLGDDSNKSSDLRAFSFNFLSRLWLWTLQSAPLDTNSKAFFLKHYSKNRYENERKGYFCELLEDLLSTKEGATFLSSLSTKERTKTPRCDANFEEYLPGLAKVLSQDSVASQGNFEKWNFKEFPPFILRNATLAAAFVEAARLQGSAEVRALAAQFKVRYPLLVAKALNAEQEKLIQSLKPPELKAATENYKSELTRSFSPSEKLLPSFKALAAMGEKTFPQVGSPKAYVFFSAWCPHCRETVSSWVKEGVEASFFKRVQLVEVSGADKNAVNEFCSLTKLSPAGCNSIVRVPKKETEKLATALNLAGVPRIVLTNAKGQVLNFDLALQNIAGRAAARDLEWMVEAAKSF